MTITITYAWVTILLLICSLSTLEAQDTILSRVATPHIPSMSLSEIWKGDTCGMKQERLVLAPIVLNRKSLFIGLSKEEIEAYFGVPDRYIERKGTKPTRMYYSLSAVNVEIWGCGADATNSFSFLIDKTTMRVVDLYMSYH